MPWDLIHLVLDLIKMPFSELRDFRSWFSNLDNAGLHHLRHLLQLEPSEVLDIQNRLSAPLTIDIPNDPLLEVPMDMMTNPNFLASPTNEQLYSLPDLGGFTDRPGIPAPVFEERAAPWAPGFQTSIIQPNESSFLSLQINRQPPNKTVYQRILKPFPSVMLVGSPDDTSNLFVEAILVRHEDPSNELPTVLDGTKVVRVNGNFAIFKKLKILQTTQQLGCQFAMKFALKTYHGTNFEDVPKAWVISDPIDVYSHTLYLTEKPNSSPTPPTVSEVLPSRGSAGTRVVILGTNFVNSPHLRVSFGDQITAANFHEKGTLICTVPPGLPVGPQVLRVANDSVHFCESNVYFAITD